MMFSQAGGLGKEDKLYALTNLALTNFALTTID